MLNKENREKCGKIIRIYPREHQLLIAMEEAGEFVQAISKHLRYGDMEPLLEEFADMEVVMEEIRQMFDISKKEIDSRCAKKLYRALDGKVLIHENLGSSRRKTDAKR